VVTGIEAVLSEAGYDMTLTVVGDAAQRGHFVNDVLPSLRRVDGTIFVDVPFSEREIESIIGLGSRVVAVGEHLPGIPGVTIDNEQAGYDATSLLVNRGHRRIALVGGLKDPEGDDTIPGRRTAGYRRAHAAAGLEVDESLLMTGNFSVSGGAEAAAELLGREERPDAIFTLSDEMAIGVISTARDFGVSIPGDLCLLGFDDHEFSDGLGLSTVRQPVVEAGEAAAQLLLDVLDGQPGRDVVLPHEVRLRATTHRG
ncbi:MAG: substrate-binding domain-containing protein, partial [Acidimicrobiia bacterium]|nr:substrate-binding domain-containing protein [Acidimicrobiia bacterium]